MLSRLACYAFSMLWLILVCACSDPAPNSSSPTWKVAFDASNTGWFLSVWGSGPNDVYTVGGSESEGIVMHFDGTEWTSVEFEQQVPLLTWVHGFAPDDITVVGNEGTVIHFDGDSWQRQPTPTEQNLWGVWGGAPNDLWAVGGRGRVEGEATLLHFDGSDWRDQPLPDLERTGVNALFKVWGTAADNIYAVGQRGAVIHLASERAFRTSPLWGIKHTAPYLHDGRADTLAQAIAAHDGEARASRKAFDDLSDDEQAALTAFLNSL